MKLMNNLSGTFRTLLIGVLASLSGCDSLTSESQSVYVNAIDELDGLRCTWSGSQWFDIMNDHVKLRAAILPYGNGPDSYILTVLVTAAPGVSLEMNSIHIGLVASSGPDRDETFQLSAVRTPLIKTRRNTVGEEVERENWSQEFSISPELVEEPGVTYFLVVDVTYQDAAGDRGQLSGRIPLRRVKIVIPTSLV